ncbi:MAG: hypothetical protein WDO70_09880 [Alphaproteobacteria bacterium]
MDRADRYAYGMAAAIVTASIISLTRDEVMIDPAKPAQQQIDAARKLLPDPYKGKQGSREGYVVACFLAGRFVGMTPGLEVNEPPPENYVRGLQNGDCIIAQMSFPPEWPSLARPQRRPLHKMGDAKPL